MIAYTDQVKHTIHLDAVPKRIISIVPSQSEFLWDIGLREDLVGISRFCIHPAEMCAKVTKVGGTKRLDIQKIRALRPDLIIGNKEENDRSQIELLQSEFNVWMSDIVTINDALDMMNALGIILDREEKANHVIHEIKGSLAGIKCLFKGESVAYFIWNDPYMFAASNTFIDHVLSYAGFTNVMTQRERYPSLSIEQLRELAPAYCFLSSEPFPFSEKHASELRRFLPGTKVVMVDGEMFSWYGSRLLKLPDYLRALSVSLAHGSNSL